MTNWTRHMPLSSPACELVSYFEEVLMLNMKPLRHIIISLILSLYLMQSTSAARADQVGTQSLDRLRLVCRGLATLDVCDFTHHADRELVAARVVSDSGSGRMISDPTRPDFPGGNAKRYSGTIYVNYATHVSWIGKTYHYSFNAPAYSVPFYSAPNFNGESLILGGEVVYTIAGDGPAFHEMPDCYLIPDGYEKLLPEVITFCQHNVTQLQSSANGRALLTALLNSPNPFLKLMAVRSLSADTIAMNSSDAPRRMIADALSDKGELQSALAATILSAGGTNAQKLMAAITNRINVSHDEGDYEYLMLGCNVTDCGLVLNADAPDLRNVYVVAASKHLQSLPRLVSSPLVVSILSASGFLSQGKL